MNTFKQLLKYSSFPLPIHILLILLVAGILMSCNRSFHWANRVNAVTIEDSWATYHTFYAHENSSTYNKDQFVKAVKKASYTTLSPEQFLNLNIENHRLGKYVFAKTAHEAYPESDRPRGENDISSVNYFLSSCLPISPITVAIMIDKKGKRRYIKLDGVHRMIAANIKKKKLRIAWIDLQEK